MDNIELIKTEVGTTLNENGAPGSILALNHKAFVNKMLDKLGKYSGFYFVAKKNGLGSYPSGTFSFEGNAMNNTANHSIRFSQKTSDLNDIGIVFDVLGIGSLLFFKDFQGRSAIYEYVSHTIDDTTPTNVFYDVVVRGFSTNYVYTYQDAETVLCGFSFMPKSGDLGVTVEAEDVLVDNTLFDVLTGNDSQTLWNETDLALLRARGTELYSGGIPSINADPTKFDVTGAVGQIKNSGYHPISTSDQTAISVVDISALSTYVYIDTAGVLQQQITKPTRDDWYDKLFLFRLASNGSQLVAFERLRNPSGQYSNSIRELYEYLFENDIPLKMGLNITPNSDLTFNRASGSVFEFGAGTETKPNTPEFGSVNNAPFFTLTQNNSVASQITNVPVVQYDNAGVLTDMTANRYTAHRLYFFTSGNMVLQYGQNQFVSLEEAIGSIGTEEYIVNPANLNGLFLGWWIVKKNTTDLSVSTDAVFKPFSIGGQSSSVVAGALLSANNLSDLANIETARNNLGLGTASLLNTGDLRRDKTVDSVSNVSGVFDFDMSTRVRRDFNLTGNATFKPINLVKDADTNGAYITPNGFTLDFILDSGSITAFEGSEDFSTATLIHITFDVLNDGVGVEDVRYMVTVVSTI